MKKISIAPSYIFYPQPIYVIGTRNGDGSANFSTSTWLTVAIDSSPHLMMTIAGHKQTSINLLREKRFAAHLVSRDMIWLADYFGSTDGREGIKDQFQYEYTWDEKLKVPLLEQSKWIYECTVSRTVEFNGSYVFFANIESVQMDEALEDMDLGTIDLSRIDPAIYAPFNYYAIGDKIGNRGEWTQHV